MISINLNKAKDIVHDIRRAKRTIEFAPLDVKASIPSEAAAAETARQAVRQKYAGIQVAIESSASISELKLVADSLK
jgi:hypothetical protein